MIIFKSRLTLPICNEQTHKSIWILHEIHKQQQESQSQKEINYPLHKRSCSGSNLLCEDGTTNLLCTRNEQFNGTTNGCSQQFSQDIAFFHRKGRSSQSESKITAIHASLSNNESDDFTIKPSLYKSGGLSRALTFSPCWATTSNSNTMSEISDSKNKELGENSHSSVRNLL